MLVFVQSVPDTVICESHKAPFAWWNKQLLHHWAIPSATVSVAESVGENGTSSYRWRYSGGVLPEVSNQH